MQIARTYEREFTQTIRKYFFGRVLYQSFQKKLGYKTPAEVLFDTIAQWIDESKLHYKNNAVALDC